MHINDSNATERLSEKTDHGSMRFGNIRDNVQAVRPNRLPQFRFSSHHFEFLVDTKASSQTVLRLFTNVIESKWPPISPYMFGLVASVGK